MKKLLIIAFGCCLLSCHYNPHEELNGHILTMENGKRLKIEWNVGSGNSWSFKEEVTTIRFNDTITEWRYVDENSFKNEKKAN